MFDPSEPSEFPSGEYDRESREVQDQYRQAQCQAEFRAMPVTRVTRVTAYNPINGFLLLECGHAVPLPETLAWAEDMIGDRGPDSLPGVL